MRLTGRRTWLSAGNTRLTIESEAGDPGMAVGRVSPALKARR